MMLTSLWINYVKPDWSRDELSNELFDEWDELFDEANQEDEDTESLDY